MVILACPGILREVEIIANEIWRLIEEEAERIGVLAPDDASAGAALPALSTGFDE